VALALLLVGLLAVVLLVALVHSKVTKGWTFTVGFQSSRNQESIDPPKPPDVESK
jgi:uncharacterized membrane protein